jgi:TPR repeat protein
MMPAYKDNSLFGVGFCFANRRQPLVFYGPPFAKIFTILDLALAFGPRHVVIAPEIQDLLDRWRPRMVNPHTADLQDVVEDADRLLALKETRKARRLLKIAESRRAGSPQYHIAKAKCMQADGVGHQRVLQFLKAAHAASPDDPDLRLFLYGHALARKNPEFARAAMDYWQINKGPSSLAWVLSAYLIHRGQYHAAVQLLHAAIHCATDPQARQALQSRLAATEKLRQSLPRRIGFKITRLLTLAWRPSPLASVVFLIICFVAGMGVVYELNRRQRQQQATAEQSRAQHLETIRMSPVRLKEAAESGDVQAMVKLWEGHRYGSRGIPKDPAWELYWLHAAAAAGDAESIRQLAFAYQRGQIVEHDLAAAFYWFSVGANAGNTWCMWELAHYYYLGLEPVEQDFAASFHWYSRACEDPRGYAQMYVGWHHELGLGTPRDTSAAYAIYHYASEQGKWWATERLSVLCYDPASLHYDPAAGWEWFLKAQEQAGSDQARWQRALRDQSIANKFRYGPFYNMGIWVQPSLANIRQWFAIGAKHGDAYCAWKLAVLHLDNFFESENDIQQGTRLLRRAIDKGLPHAIGYAAMLYADPGHPLYNSGYARELGTRAAALNFPPPGPYLLP